MEDILKQLGQRHKKMGIKASYFPFMGKAVNQVLNKELGSYFEERQNSWDNVFDEMSGEIVKAVLS